MAYQFSHLAEVNDENIIGLPGSWSSALSLVGRDIWELVSTWDSDRIIKYWGVEIIDDCLLIGFAYGASEEVKEPDHAYGKGYALSAASDEALEMVAELAQDHISGYEHVPWPVIKGKVANIVRSPGGGVRWEVSLPDGSYSVRVGELSQESSGMS